MTRTSFAIRVEHLEGHEDVNVGSSNLFAARVRFEAENPDLAPFDWRGAVVFCERRRPAEEKTR